ncbi:MAG TPA: zf-HC2 domain-containing protein, partial [Candidatus Binataceae bacterium]|nr:zf-HC2 domain-containing protein [Candidatus Binataceae bacterium]
MDHREYIEEFLSAQADGELNGEELRAAEAHVALCPQCAARLAEERSLKALVRKHSRAQLPSQVQSRLMTMLAEEAARGEGALEPQAGAQRGAPHERGLRVIRRPAVWLPIAAAACLAIAFVGARQMGYLGGNAVRVVYHQNGNPEFDVATAYFAKFERNFQPNVPSDTYGDISGAYLDHHMPGHLWNFNNAGMQLVGGRLEKLPDGRLATLTLYRGSGNSVMCIRFKASSDQLPPGPV